jgi:hypothetical protein
LQEGNMKIEYKLPMYPNPRVRIKGQVATLNELKAGMALRVWFFGPKIHVIETVAE